MEHALRKAAELAGSVSALARAIGMSQQTVWAWIYRKSIPPEHCAAVERATGGAVMRWDLRPEDWREIWPELAERTDAPRQVA